MRKIIRLVASVLAGLVLAGSPAFAQRVGFSQHLVGGLYHAPAYGQWQALMISGNTSTGSQSVVIAGNASGITLRDGTTLPIATVFNTNVPLMVDEAGSNPETVTPTSVSVGACPSGALGVGAGAQCATVTASFSFTHGEGAIVKSGDAGIYEAFTDAGNNGGGLVFWQVDTGNVTLSTSGATTTATTKVPHNFLSMGASAYVETTIATATNWAVGITGSTSAFCTANTGLTAGTTCIANMNSPATVGTSQSLTAILITTTGSQTTAGVVKVRAWGFSAIQSLQ